MPQAQSRSALWGQGLPPLHTFLGTRGCNRRAVQIFTPTRRNSQTQFREKYMPEHSTHNSCTAAGLRCELFLRHASIAWRGIARRGSDIRVLARPTHTRTFLVPCSHEVLSLGCRASCDAESLRQLVLVPPAALDLLGPPYPEAFFRCFLGAAGN